MKMTTATRTSKQAEITPLARVYIKLSGIVVWLVASTSGSDYKVVVVDGKVSSCETTTGEPCKGWRFNHKCHHTTLVQSREDQRRVHVTPDNRKLTREEFCIEFGIYE
jgi:hypothetical protein